MWDDWKRAWEQAVENFERELNAPDADFASPSHRANAMSRDVQMARTALGRLEGDLEQAGKDLKGEEESEQTARRRADMAQRIEDAETVRIALEFAERHASRALILRRKVEVLRDELVMRREELASMEEQVTGQIDAAPESERVTTTRSQGDILERDKQDHDFREMERLRREKEAEARLEELKKKMQQ